MSRNSDISKDAFLQGADPSFIESMYQKYARDAEAVASEWSDYFRSLADERKGHPTEDGDKSAHLWQQPLSKPTNGNFMPGIDSEELQIQGDIFGEKIERKARATGESISNAQLRSAALDSVRLLMLIRAYRIRGHLIADLDPLGLSKQDEHSELTLEHYGFREADLDRKIFLDKVLGLEIATPRQVMSLLQHTYCRTFALQYMHISDPEAAGWLKERIEGFESEILFTRRGRTAILNKLVEAEGFERYLHAKFPGTKRFGLDGGEAIIPAMEQIIKRGGSMGLREIVIGMPHRGRLNMLANVMKKPFKAIFHEFRGGPSQPNDFSGSGDVKYHLGASSDREFDNNKVHLSLTANPSHLEAVNPVVLGKARAKQRRFIDELSLPERQAAVMPVLFHGDAAFAGQGVVAECFGLSGLRGHRTGGAIHIIINNQIGFTTAPHNARSSPYPSDIALMVEAPIFHVNGDDPEAVVHAARVATEFRQTFLKDVVINMFCYRRYGHNEGDEPMFTQPKMYRRIRQHKTTLALYTERLAKQGIIEIDGIDRKKEEFRQLLDNEMEAASSYCPSQYDWLNGRWLGMHRGSDTYIRGETGVEKKTLLKIGKAISSKPKNIKLHKTIARIQDNRRAMIETGTKIDWATAEALAFGSLLLEKISVRLSGQDSSRGTFSQRHSALVDQDTEERYYPLNHIDKPQALCEVVDSMLSEYAVLGYEYGYSLADPHTLTIWEAQFGDFANGAQIMIDQFISSGEDKWLRMSGLVILLPHGLEGQGPEHSSARIERFLQLSAEENWIIANCTTPANYFHILRRQMHRDFRKPLIIFTPKSLLRHKLCISSLKEFAKGSSFHRLLPDDAEAGTTKIKLIEDAKIRRVILCSGKIYYDLLTARDVAEIDDIYLLRIEQLFPYPQQRLAEELSRFKQAQFVWCQEEPLNQGAWSYINPKIEQTLLDIEVKYPRPECISRPDKAAPATGYLRTHQREQMAIVNRALTIMG